MCAIEEPQVCFLSDEENRRLCFSFLSLKHISTALRDALGLHVSKLGRDSTVQIEQQFFKFFLVFVSLFFFYLILIALDLSRMLYSRRLLSKPTSCCILFTVYLCISKYTFFYASFFFLSACDDLRDAIHTYHTDCNRATKERRVEQSPLSNSAVPLHRRLNYLYVFISIMHMCIRFQYLHGGGSGINRARHNFLRSPHAGIAEKLPRE